MEHSLIIGIQKVNILRILKAFWEEIGLFFTTESLEKQYD